MALTEEQASATATEWVTRYAPGAPASVQEAAVELLANTLRTHTAVSNVEFADERVAYHDWGPSAIRRSGALPLLAPWRRVRARAIEAAS